MSIILGAASTLLILIALYIAVFVQPFPHNYNGDGKFVDKGLFASSYRYVLTLDEYELSSREGGSYFVGSLPQTDMHIGLRFILANNDSRELVDNLRIRLSIYEIGETHPYFRYEGKLYHYDGSFTPTLYRHATEGTVLTMYSQEPVTQPLTILGWRTGLYSVGPRQIEFRLLAPIPEPLRHNEAELIIFGGGWK